MNPTTQIFIFYLFFCDFTMDSIMRALKTSKRRITQQVKVATGQSDVTSDATYDIAYRQFCDVEKNLSTLHAQCVALVSNIDNWCNTNRKLADELKRFTNTANSSSEEMEIYKETVVNLHSALQGEYEQTRRALMTILRTRIIARIDHLLKDDFSQVHKIVKARKNIIMDFDSHRDKCSQFERKGDNDKADRFRRKAEHDKQMLDEHTAYLEERFDELIEIGSIILNKETATLITCEMYLVKRQYEAMVGICNNFGDDVVSAVTYDIDDVIARIQEGENVESNYVAPELDLPEPKNMEIPQVTAFKDAPRKQSIVEEEEYEPQPQPQRRKPLPTPGTKKQYVIAMYALEAEEEGELSFQEGDRIEVIRKDPSGWWEGKLHGVVGIFPENYTQPA